MICGGGGGGGMDVGEIMEGGARKPESTGGGGGGGGDTLRLSEGGGGGAWLSQVEFGTVGKVGTEGGGTAMPRLETGYSLLLCMLSAVPALFLLGCSLTWKQWPTESKAEYDIGALE